MMTAQKTWLCADKQPVIWLLLALMLLALTGCAAQPQVEQGALTGEIALSAANPVGQTFVARYEGLSGIYFHFSPGEAGDGEIILHLRSDSQAREDLATSYTTVRIDTVNGPGIYGFFVPAQADSNQTYYYAFLEVTGSGSVEVGSGPGGSYLDGALYEAHTPLDAQAVFQLSYSRKAAAIGLAGEVGSWLGVLLVSIFLYILPGWGFLAVLLPGWGGLRWPEKIGLSAGMSLALYPLLFLWTDLLGLHLGAAYAWLLPLLGGYLLVWKNRDDVKSVWRAISSLRWRDLPKIANPQFSWPEVTLLILLALIVFTRFWAIRSLEAPMWGDGYQHTLITQLLIDNGGLFTSWQPYAELTTFTYHFGFHSASAVFHWLTGQDAIHAVLWVGQILNVLAVLVLYPLATRVSGGSRWAGVVAVLVAGLLSPMPMFYVNWGRYTQLAGQVILPVAVWLAWEGLMNKKPGWGAMITSAIVMAGIGVNHYRILIFAIPFFVVIWLYTTFRQRNFIATLQLFLMGSIGAGLFLPWFVRIFSGKILAFLGYQLTTPASSISTEMMQYNNEIGDLALYLPIFIWFLWLLGLAWGLWKQDQKIAFFHVGWLLIFLAANPHWLMLPGTGALSNFAVMVALYIPASVALGCSAGWLHARFSDYVASAQPWLHSMPQYAFALLLVILGSVNINRQIVQPETYALVTRPDVIATEWIGDNLPHQSKTLVNAFSSFGGTVIVGSDGGWWLPLLADRATTLPPINYTNEKSETPDLRTQLNTLYEKVLTKPFDKELVTSLKEQGITHIYLGQRQGIVNSNGIHILPYLLTESEQVRLLYHQDRVWLFEIMP